MPYDDIIERHAKRVGLDPKMMKKIMQAESGGRAGPESDTGSYRGLFQLDQPEFKRHGGTGSIHDPEQNTMAAANKLAQESLAFKQRHGRDPKLIDIYMIHQQGEGGYAAHLANPDAPAWKNMASTGEGKKKGEEWAKKAIWGNLPRSEKDRLGSVENVTSRDFVQSWGSRMEGSPEFKEAGEITAKTAFVEGKNTPERKPTLMGMSPDVPQPHIDLRIPEFTPRFKVG